MFSAKTVSPQQITLSPVHGATTRIDDDGLLVVGDSASLDYHLLRWTNDNVNGARIKLKIIAKPAPGCDTHLYVHHWGHKDVCSIAKDGTVVLNEDAEDISITHHYDGFIEVTVTFQNNHNTISLGMGRPHGLYKGTGTDQYIFQFIEIEILRPTHMRQYLVERIWRGNDPLRDVPNNLFEFDLQGWRSQHIYLKNAIELIRPSVIVEIGVWKGGSTIFMAQMAKSLGLDTVVIAVDTWLGSSEHWLNPVFFSEMSFLNGYPALYRKFTSNIVHENLADYVLPLPISSIGAAEILAALGVTAGIVHLDAAHDYESVVADLRNWWPILEPGGVFIGDDYHGAGDAWPGVQRAFDEFFGALGLSIEEDDGKCRILKPR